MEHCVVCCEHCDLSGSSACVWPSGVLLISLALCADAAIGNVQEKAMKLHNGSNSEMVRSSLS